MYFSSFLRNVLLGDVACVRRAAFSLVRSEPAECIPASLAPLLFSPPAPAWGNTGREAPRERSGNIQQLTEKPTGEASGKNHRGPTAGRLKCEATKNSRGLRPCARVRQRPWQQRTLDVRPRTRYSRGSLLCPAQRSANRGVDSRTPVHNSQNRVFLCLGKRPRP